MVPLIKFLKYPQKPGRIFSEISLLDGVKFPPNECSFLIR